ncbi:MAG: hypothetical protein CM15mP127_14700 [Gammaproteobacteria bacterium]|nr:MAG: hypothetical protein CM15mP127_14700 [Gammaproteobacteria bacterium]
MLTARTHMNKSESLGWVENNFCRKFNKVQKLNLARGLLQLHLREKGSIDTVKLEHKTRSGDVFNAAVLSEDHMIC